MFLTFLFQLIANLLIPFLETILHTIIDSLRPEPDQRPLFVSSAAVRATTVAPAAAAAAPTATATATVVERKRNLEEQSLALEVARRCRERRRRRLRNVFVWLAHKGLPSGFGLFMMLYFAVGMAIRE